jgi:hypothetical protein
VARSSRRLRRVAHAALTVAVILGLGGCGASADGPRGAGAAPMAVVLAASSSIVSTSARSAQPRDRAPAPRRRPAVAPAGAGDPGGEPTPAGPRRPPVPAPRHALPASAAIRLAAPACATYSAALAGRAPPAVLARGSRRAAALVAQSVAATLLGLPVAAAPASRPSRERLGDALARLQQALAGPDDAAPMAIAQAMAPRIRAYAATLGIGACG